MSNENLKFQCIMCFSSNNISRDQLGHQFTCTNCNQVNQLPNSSFGAGRIIGKDFVIKKRIGSGGMGSVFVARQMSMDRDVALKVLFYRYTTDSKYIDQFRHEAQVSARLSHTNIVQTIAFGDDSHILYIAMNYINGYNLEQLIQMNQFLSVSEALSITQQVAEGLYASWTELRLVHRDIKPANIVIDKNGTAKILDFGLARAPGTIGGSTTVGSPAYMSPEQLTSGKIDFRSDIYSLGITLYQSIYGKLPFNGNDAQEVALKHLQQKISFDGNVKVPRKVCNLIRTMVDKDPNGRFKSHGELIDKILEVRKQITVDQASNTGIHHAVTSSIRGLTAKNKKPKSLAEHQTEKKIEQIHRRTNRGLTLTLSILITVVCILIFTFFKNDPEAETIEVVDNKINNEINETLKKQFALINSKLKRLGENNQELSGTLNVKLLNIEAELEKTLATEADKTARYKSDIKDIQTKLTALHKSIEAENSPKIATIPDRHLSNHIYENILSHTLKHNYDHALTYIDMQKLSPKNSDMLSWLQLVSEVVTVAKKIDETIKSDIGYFKGQTLFENWTLRIISGTKCTFVDKKTGKDLVINLYKLPNSVIYKITKSEWKSESNCKKAISAWLLFQRRLQDYYNWGIIDSEIEKIIENYITQQCQELRILAEIETKNSVSQLEKRAKSLLTATKQTKWEDSVTETLKEINYKVK